MPESTANSTPDENDTSVDTGASQDALNEQAPGQVQSVEEAVAFVRDQWGTVIQTMIAACSGSPEAAAQLAPFLDEMEQKPDWRNLTGVLRRILAGEREPLSLLHGLDDTDTLVAGDVLRGLGVDVPLPELEDEEDNGQMISLEDFIRLVAQACQPGAPAGLAEQMETASRGMALQASAAPEVRELGRVLNLILSGERSPDLGALPPPFAQAIRGLLGQLEPHS